ncbi:MAG: hypothetical protein HXY20_13640 [Acidobacteria bacterium]|nr:hypothetical protein [Acidobacteriota bacterium]
MDKIVLPYEPTIIVYYCDSNDINAGEKAEAISARFREFAASVHARLPDTQVFFVSINQAPQKQDRRDVVDDANRLVRGYCLTDRRLGFIEVKPGLFDGEGNPRLELCLEDKLHFKPHAYAEFAAVIKPIIAKAWGKRPAPAPGHNCGRGPRRRQSGRQQHEGGATSHPPGCVEAVFGHTSAGQGRPS